MRYEPGAAIPRHRHLGDEQIYVLEGSVSDDAGTCRAGNYARRPPGCVHTVRSEHGALVLAITSGPTEPVELRGALPPTDTSPQLQEAPRAKPALERECTDDRGSHWRSRPPSPRPSPLEGEPLAGQWLRASRELR